MHIPSKTEIPIYFIQYTYNVTVWVSFREYHETDIYLQSPLTSLSQASLHPTLPNLHPFLEPLFYFPFL